MSIKISDNGYIYEVGAKRKRLLGHISSLLREQNPLGEKIRKWWQAYLKTV
jgi:hypothetical protein